MTLQHIVANYKKGVELTLLIRKLKDMYISSKEPGLPTLPGGKGALDIATILLDRYLGR